MKKIKIFLLLTFFLPKTVLALSVSDLMFKSATTLEHQTSYIKKNNFKRKTLKAT